MAQKPFSQFPRIASPKGSDLLGISRDDGGGFTSLHVELDQLGVALGYILLRDEKPPGTPGGASTGGAWQTRDLNTERYDTGNDCELAANVFTLQPGTYEIFVRCPVAQSNETVARLYNVTQGWVELVGSNHWHDLNDVGGMSDCFIHNRFTITVPTQFRIEQWFGNGAGQGRGFAVNGSTNEVYTEVVLRKVSRTGVASNTGGVDYLGEFATAANVIDITGVLDSATYSYFVIDVVDMLPTIAGAAPWLRFLDGTTPIAIANYGWAMGLGGENSRASHGGVNGDTHIEPIAGNGLHASLPNRFNITMQKVDGSPYFKVDGLAAGVLGPATPDIYSAHFMGVYNQVQNVDGLRVTVSTGGVLQGTARAWGYRT